MDLDYLGLQHYDTSSPGLKKVLIRAVLENFDVGCSYESCCWAAEVDPDTFTQWRQEDPRLERACRKRLALIEKENVRIMRGKPAKEGDTELPTPTDRKFAADILKQTNRYWGPKQTSGQLSEGLAELSKALPPATYALVVGTLHKHLNV